MVFLDSGDLSLKQFYYNWKIIEYCIEVKDYNLVLNTFSYVFSIKIIQTELEDKPSITTEDLVMKAMFAYNKCISLFDCIHKSSHYGFNFRIKYEIEEKKEIEDAKIRLIEQIMYLGNLMGINVFPSE
jgi:hypothetical protein